MKKTYVLDTNILISSGGSAILGFDDNDVVITTTTLEELDNLKNSRNGDTGYNARQSIRLISEIIKNAGTNTKRIPLSNGGTFTIEPNGQSQDLLPAGMSLDKADNRIISSTKSISINQPDQKTILVTNDIAMQVKARSAGVTSQGYRNDELDTDDVYTGRRTMNVASETIDKIYNDKRIDINKVKGLTEGDTANMTENEFVLMKGVEGNSAIGIYQNGEIKIIDDNKLNINGIRPMNVGQKFALYALMSDEFPLVILQGVAGSGKTFLATSVGMAGTFNDHDKHAASYNSMIYTRNNVLFDEDIGFLPGDEQDKMAPLVRPLTDNLESLLRVKGDSPEEIRQKVDDFMYTGIIKVESMAFMRGRNINHNFVIIDEIQNATPRQIRGICTRAGEGTKIILCGDPSQVDNNLLSPKNNGLVFASQKMKGSKICAQVTFNGEKECVRSLLAKEAADRLTLDNQ